jgi:hypothetical protein
MSQTEALLERPPDPKDGSDTRIDAQGFRVLRCRRSAEKQLLPFLKTTVDFDIVCEVAYHERTRVPLTVKHLILLELAPQMTVFRRLNRLCELGIIMRTRAAWDARVHELRLAASVHRLLMQCACGSSSEEAE